MATLQATTINGTLTATTSYQSPIILNTNSSQVLREFVGTAFIPSSANSATNHVDLFANVGVHERMYGIVRFWVNQGQFHTGQFYFQLSEYGLSTSIITDSSGYFSLSRHNPSYGTNFIRFTNTVGAEWGNGTYYFNVRWTGLGGATFSSSYLTERVR